MATNLICASPIQGLIMRAIKLNACGVPVTGTGSAMIVMDGFTQVQDSPQYDTGSRVIERKADGTLCQNFKVPDQFTNDEVTIDICSWNPGLIPLMLSGRLLTATSSPTGTGFAHGTWSNATQAHWSYEVWGAPPQGCPPGQTFYPYFAWPHLSDAKRGDFTITSDAATILQIKANSYDASPLWTAGNSFLGTGQVVYQDHFLYNLESTVPPPSQCVLLDYP